MPGSTEVFALLNALGNPEATKKALKELVEQTDAHNKAAAAAQAAKDELTAESDKQVVRLEKERKASELVAQRASDDTVAAKESMRKLDTEYSAKGKELDERQEHLATQEAAHLERVSVAVNALEERAVAVVLLEQNAKNLKVKAEHDAGEAAKARALYEGKLADIQAQLKNLAK